MENIPDYNLEVKDKVFGGGSSSKETVSIPEEGASNPTPTITPNVEDHHPHMKKRHVFIIALALVLIAGVAVLYSKFGDFSKKQDGLSDAQKQAIINDLNQETGPVTFTQEEKKQILDSVSTQ